MGGSIPLDDLFVEKEAGEGADYDRNDPDDLGGLMTRGIEPGLFVIEDIEEGTRNEKSSFYLYTELESILLGCFLHFLLIAI